MNLAMDGMEGRIFHVGHSHNDDLGPMIRSAPSTM
jgi:hypothetical protein